MIKVDVFSGFLGAGKTTLIKKLINEAYHGEKLVLIENEFGEIGIDGDLFGDSEIAVTEINSGCICCSLAGDFTSALNNIVEKFSPERILIEPSGVGKLSDIASAIQSVDNDELVINSMVTVVDAAKCKMYMKNFGEFFENQIEYAGVVILSHVDSASEKKLNESLDIIKEINETASVVTTPWDKLSGEQLLEAIECKDTLEKQIQELLKDHDEHGHHHDHDHDHDEHGHHHDHDRDDHDHDEHEHHHDHDHDDHEHDEHGHHHDHDHDHGDECSCGCGHDHHHDADEIFDSWGIETAATYTVEELTSILEEFEKENTYGLVIRAKGIVENPSGEFLHFDYIPGEINIKNGGAAVTGRICVIGSKINKESISNLFKK